MERYALLGWPVKHSVSPQMQEAGFKHYHLDASYQLVEVKPEKLGECVSVLRQEAYAGWNITVPHKEQMAQYLDQVDPVARAAGSVNTVVNDHGRLRGYSTDGYGLARAVKEAFDLDVAGRRFFFLGTGGAARATAVYFACQGAAELVLVNRTLSRAEQLAQTISDAAPDCRVITRGLDDAQQYAALLSQTDCVIQATSVGLHKDDPAPVDVDLLPSGIPVMDMIYRKTPFLKGAAERGCPVSDGRAMLLYQGVRSFELWTGKEAPVEVMRQALNQALETRANQCGG